MSTTTETTEKAIANEYPQYHDMNAAEAFEMYGLGAMSPSDKLKLAEMLTANILPAIAIGKKNSLIKSIMNLYSLECVLNSAVEAMGETGEDINPREAVRYAAELLGNEASNIESLLTL